VLNSGSSSLKFGVFGPDGEDETPILEGAATGIGHSDGSLRVRSATGEILLDEPHAPASQSQALARVAAVLAGTADSHGGWPGALVHRLVHGGPRLREHQRLSAAVLRQLQEAVHFAPLHLPPALELIAQAREAFPGVPDFACFDNAFHRTMPARTTRLPLPRRYADAGVIRYGFHGLSYESVVHRFAAAVPARMVVAHLGSGSSVCALHDGKSVDTSMSFTPTGGLPMSTRSGDLDPGVLLYLLRTERLGADALERLLARESGLQGLAGESDMARLVELSARGDADAGLAIDVFATAVRKSIGAYAALLGGIDLLVFTGGIGEHGEAVRRLVCDNLQFLGLAIDAGSGSGKAAEGGTDGAAGGKAAGVIGTIAGAVPIGSKVAVMAAQEELQMARHCRRLLDVASRSG
jgi:acetate kinase